MKLFKTNNIDIVNYCRTQLNFELPIATVRSQKFEVKYIVALIMYSVNFYSCNLYIFVFVFFFSVCCYFLP